MRYHTKQFSHDKGSPVLIAEASTLDFVIDEMNRIHPDRHGFTLVSQNTNSEVKMYLERINYDAGDDTEAWVFKAVPAAVQQNPSLAGLEVHILND